MQAIRVLVVLVLIALAMLAVATFLLWRVADHTANGNAKGGTSTAANQGNAPALPPPSSAGTGNLVQRPAGQHVPAHHPGPIPGRAPGQARQADHRHRSARHGPCRGEPESGHDQYAAGGHQRRPQEADQAAGRARRAADPAPAVAGRDAQVPGPDQPVPGAPGGLPDEPVARRLSARGRRPGPPAAAPCGACGPRLAPGPGTARAAA
jgi:hypothetical protein